MPDSHPGLERVALVFSRVALLAMILAFVLFLAGVVLGWWTIAAPH